MAAHRPRTHDRLSSQVVLRHIPKGKAMATVPSRGSTAKRRILLGCWGSFQSPDVCDYTYENMDKWGRAMYVTPGVIVDGQLVTNDLVDINLGMRILLGSSYYDDWQNQETFVKNDPLGNPVDQRHPWNQTTTRSRRSATSTATTPGSCRRAGTTSARAIT